MAAMGGGVGKNNQRMNTEFPKFWYESNACWGMVKSVQDLVEKARLQLAENNDITTIDLFWTSLLNRAGTEC